MSYKLCPNSDKVCPKVGRLCPIIKNDFYGYFFLVYSPAHGGKV